MDWLDTDTFFEIAPAQFDIMDSVLSFQQQFLATLNSKRCTYWEYHIEQRQFNFCRSYWDEETQSFIAYNAQGDAPELLTQCHKEDLQKLFRKWYRHYRGYRSTFHCLFRYRADEQSTWQWIDAQGRIIKSKGQQRLLMTGTYKNVTRVQQYQQQLCLMAKRDPLTLLPNRYALQEDFDNWYKQTSNNHKIAVLYLDLDGFKEVNDLINHQAGDTLLSTLAQRLTSLVRASDTVYRVGGDEFVVCIPRYKNDQELRLAAQRIIQAFDHFQFTLSGHTIQVGISIGIAAYLPGDTLETLLARSDSRMYQVKRHGKNGYFFCDSVINSDEE